MNRLNAVLMLGAVTGLAAAGAWRLLRPAPRPLAAALGRVGASNQHAPPAATLVGRWAQAATARLDVPAAVAADLRLVGRSAADHLAAKALWAFLGGLLPLAWAGLLALVGVPASGTTTLLIAAALAGGGFVWPDLQLHREAAVRRRDFLTALGSFLDLVVIALAGGAGVEGALRSAASVGKGWAFTELRAALAAAQFNRDNVWDALGALGRGLRVPVLEEIAATVGLAGAEGATVRDSLVAKTAALRQRQLSEAEADAQSATERMAIPTVLLLAGFMALIGYPALHAVLVGL